MSLSSITEVFGMSRQAYYQRRRREKESMDREEKILRYVRMVRKRHPRMGTRKILVKIRPMLEGEGIEIGRDRLFDLLRSRGLLVERRRRRRKTTIGGGGVRASNLIKGKEVKGVNQVWVVDITYLERRMGGYRYLFLVRDLP